MFTVNLDPGASVTDQRSATERVDSQSLWFSHPAVDVTPRRVTLTRERVIAEALTIISADGVEALSMRALATRLAVVPGAVYRHVRNKEELQDLVLDAVLGDVDLQVDPAEQWSEQVTALAERLRTVLEAHRGIAGLLKTRAPVTPHSLGLTEAFLTSLAAAGLPQSRTALAYHLVYDYTLGFALSDHSSPSEQRVRDETTRHELHAFLRSLPADRFPLLTALGEQVWADDRDRRFAANLATLITGIQMGARS